MKIIYDKGSCHVATYGNIERKYSVATNWYVPDRLGQVVMWGREQK